LYSPSASLAVFNTGVLFEFSVKLLNFPTQGARILYILRTYAAAIGKAGLLSS